MILMIFGSFVTQETLILDERDPPWFNKKVKLLFEAKIKLPKIIGVAKILLMSTFLSREQIYSRL